MAAARHRWILALFGSSALIYACVSDSNGPDVVAVDGGTTIIEADGSGIDGGTVIANDGGSAKDGGSSDAPLVCEGGTLACGNECAVVASSGTHCGRCFHDCGGAACVQGKCTPSVVVPSILGLGGFAASDASVYYSSTDSNNSSTEVDTCLGTGCAPAQTIFASQALGSQTDGVFAEQGLVTFRYTKVSSSGAVYVCPISGCGSSPLSASGQNSDVFGGGAAGRLFIAGGKFSSSISVADCTADASSCATTTYGAGGNPAAGLETDMVFSRQIDGGYNLVYCNAQDAGGCTSNPGIVTTTAPDQVVIAGGKLYALTTGSTGQPTGHIRSCALPCASGPTDLIAPILDPTEMAIDATSIYWIAAVSDTIFTCPITGCVTGPKAVLVGLGDSPQMLRSDLGFLYWVTTDNNDAGLPYSAIHRVAKP
jgi:hypothetical protein